MTAVRLLHPKNTELPISFTLSGITALIKPLQELKAESPILVTEFGRLILLGLLGSLMVFKLRQLENALLPILSRVSGILTFFSLVQERKVPSAILVILAGIIMLSSEEQA